MLRKNIVETLKSIKEKYDSAAPLPSNIDNLIRHMQRFLDSEGITKNDYHAVIYDYQLIDFFNSNPEVLSTWKSCFQNQETTNTLPFWNSDINNLLSGKVKLLLSGVKKETFEELVKSRVFTSGVFDLIDEYNVLFNKISALPRYKNNLSNLELWELFCLSGKPEALEYAFKTLELKPTSKNEFGEYPIHLAVLSDSKQQVWKAVSLGCDLQQKTDLSKLTPLEIANADNRVDMSIYLKRVLGDQQLNQKVAIYIDLGIALERYSPTVEDIEQYSSKQVLREEVLATKPIDFTMIASRLANASAHGVMQVGESVDEVKAILNQHSYYKHAEAYYAVKVYVDLEDLEHPMNEREIMGPNVINARGGTHWILKANANIQSENIKDIVICVPNPHLSIISSCINESYDPNRVNNCNSNTLQVRIKEFLSNMHFWKKHVYQSKAYIGLPLLPSPIREMLALCEEKNTFRLENFRSIAKKNVVNDASGLTSYVSSFFRQDTVVNSFYRTVANAKTLYEVVDWIDKHNQEALLQPDSRSMCHIV